MLYISGNSGFTARTLGDFRLLSYSETSVENYQPPSGNLPEEQRRSFVLYPTFKAQCIRWCLKSFSFYEGC